VFVGRESFAMVVIFFLVTKIAFKTTKLIKGFRKMYNVTAVVMPGHILEKSQHESCFKLINNRQVWGMVLKNGGCGHEVNQTHV